MTLRDGDHRLAEYHALWGEVRDAVAYRRPRGCGKRQSIIGTLNLDHCDDSSRLSRLRCSGLRELNQNNSGASVEVDNNARRIALEASMLNTGPKNGSPTGGNASLQSSVKLITRVK